MRLNIHVRGTSLHLLAPAIAGGAVSVALMLMDRVNGALALALVGTLLSFAFTWRSHGLLLERLADCEVRLAAALSGGGFLDLETGLATVERLRVDWVQALARFQRRGERFCATIFTIRPSQPSALEAADVLRVAGAGVGRLTRAEDSVYRLGDSHIGVLLAGSDHAGAIAFVLRVQDKLGLLTLDDGQVVPVEIDADIVDWREGPERFPDDRLPAGQAPYFGPRIFSRLMRQKPASADVEHGHREAA